MSLIRAILSAVLCATFCLVAAAEEKITRFDVDIDVQTDGDIRVTETIAVISEGKMIRRGIFRDLPATYGDDKTGGALPYQYDVISVTRNGDKEPYEISTEGNAKRIRIGNPDRRLARGAHTYSIRYEVKNQIRYQDGFDELYWNATGTYWDFPIDEVEVTITLPDGARVLEKNGYTGRFGQDGSDYRTGTLDDGVHVFSTIRPLSRREGLTVSVTMAKGLIDPLSKTDRGWLWWMRYGSIAILGSSLLGLLGFYHRSFDAVGRDPAKPPVFAQYEPPEGYSPAAVHHIYHRRFSGHEALTASLMQMAVAGHTTISGKKNDTRIELKSGGNDKRDLPADTDRLMQDLFSGDKLLHFDGKPNTGFVSDYTRFKSRVSKAYGKSYFKWNFGYVIVGASLTLAALVFALNLVTFWSIWHTLGIVGLILLNLLFMYLMPAPTRKGQKIRSHIEGFKLYMEKAEALQLNAVEVGSEAPPPMTKERYEAFLPYAVALGVEKPWTKHFEKLVPEIAKEYSPGWAHMGGRNFGLHGINKSVTNSISSGVSSSFPQSSGSSGSGGGGFSGGGGGGGGGGGW